MLERQLNHLADLMDGLAEAANVVIRNVDAARLFHLDELRQQLDFSILCDLNHTAWNAGDHAQSNFLQTKCRLIEEHPE